jgi:nucleotide-binding universal stress UspA family protein
MKILVAVDFSDFSKRAVREVARRPWPRGTQMRLLSVVEPLDFAASQIFVPDFLETMTDAVKRAMEPLAAELKQRGRDVTTVVVPGYPRIDIAVQARQFSADLIIMGSRGLGAIGRFLLGSVARAVIRNAPCSVEVVRRPGDGQETSTGMRLLLATDGSPCSHEAARTLARRPWPDGSEVRIVCVAQTTSPHTPWVVHANEWTRLKEENRKAAGEIIEATRRLVEGANLPVSTAVLEGQPKHELVEECGRWQADLIFVGSHGRRGLEWLLLGSVSEAVVTHAPCSVEVVREKPGSRS